MSSLSYVGKQPSVSSDITNRGVTTTILQAATPSQTSVQAQINALVACTVSGNTLTGGTYATRVAVDTLNATFETISYYQTQDLLNIPNSALGTVGTIPTQLGTSGYYGVASLDASTKIPAAQIPALGAGIIKGPYGTTAQAAGTTGTTPVKIADWGPTSLHPANVAFKPLVYMIAEVAGVMAKPMIDVFITNATTAPTLFSSAGTLIARGEGRSLWNDNAMLSVGPMPDATSENPSSPAAYPTSYNVWVTAWLYDAESYNSTSSNSVSVGSGDIVTASLYLMRTAQ